MTKKQIKELVKDDLYGWIKNAESDENYLQSLGNEKEIEIYLKEFQNQINKLLKFLKK